MRALLVAPEPAAHDVLRTVLTRRGWQLTARAGDEVRQALRREAFDLIVLHHPADPGALALCRAVREAAGRGAYLLALTACGDPDTVTRLGEAGVDDFLLLPLAAEPLEGRIALAEHRLSMRDRSDPVRLTELEQTLRVHQASLDELFQCAPEGIAIVDEHDRVVRINDEFTRMFGYTAEQVIGRQMNDLIAPAELMHEAIGLTHGVRHGRRVVYETRRRRSDGSLLEVSVLATPIQVGGGPIGAFAIYRDISVRKAQERALQASEARYRALFDQSPVGVFLCDPELRITHCNERLVQIVGAAPHRVVGTSLEDVAPAELLRELTAAREGRPAAYEGPFTPPARPQPLLISVRFQPLRDAAGTLVGGMGVVEDVTERVRAQEQLRAQAEELERVNGELRERTLELEAAMRARSRLYSALNHELRTPISVVMLYQELLLAGTVGRLAPEQAEALTRAHGAARHLLDVVRDVLDLSKMEAGRVSVNPVEVSLSELLEELHAAALPLAERHGSELHLQLEPESPRIVTDPLRVRQIVLNLLSNAAKFGAGRPIVLRCRTTPDQALIEVVDRGIGIADSDLPHVFDEFVQLGSGQDAGTGLGLAISRRLAELLQGRLEAESEAGEGTTFRLLLPLASTLESSPAHEAMYA